MSIEPGKLLKYVGRPYEDYNCFDLVKDFYREFFDLDLRHYYEGTTLPEREQIQTLIISGVGDFERVTIPQPGDIVVVNLYGYSCHIGICLEAEKMLHTIRKVGSCIEPLKKYGRHIEGFYRHRVRGDSKK